MMPQMLEKDTGRNNNSKLHGANERRSGLGRRRIYRLPRRKKNKSHIGRFLNPQTVKNWFHCCQSPGYTTPRGEMCQFKVQKHELLTSCPWRTRPFSAGPSLLLSPGADVQPFPGGWLAHGLPLGHLDTEICQRELLRAIPPRCIPATLREKRVESGGMCARACRTGSAVGCCSSVAMDHLNSLCCIHVGWEQRCVRVLSDRNKRARVKLRL